MENDKRIPLQKNSWIILRDDKGTLKTFYIDNEIARGSSAICYKAYYIDDSGNRISGSLKEFYPYDFFSPAFDLVRDDSVEDERNNQLYSKKGTRENFLVYKNGYERPYATLTEVRGQKNPEVTDLNSYIPSYEILKGIPRDDDPDNYSIYVWVKNESGFVTFKDVLSEVCSRMSNEKYDRIKDLDLLLHCIEELAKGVDTLHLFSLFHLDLKAENFGIATFRRKPNKNISISLYDLNSLYSGRNRDAVVLSSGTKYFRSPEVKKRNVRGFGISSDIYSLGALLYYSLVINSYENSETGQTEFSNIHFCEGKDEFDKVEYDNIGVNLRNSLLIDDSDETENSIIFRKLLAILKKSLNVSEYNNEIGYYSTAEEFAADLSEVIELLGLKKSKSAFDIYSEFHVETVSQKKEEYFAAKNKNGAAGVIQWLLFKYPLYDYCIKRNDVEEGCNVLVLGGGTYSSKFIDLAFELSQVKNCLLNVTVVSNDPDSDKAAYLSTRPGMFDFFEIDGEPACRPELITNPYGRLSFKKADLFTEDDVPIRVAIDNVCKAEQYTYVFIALGKEKANREVAKQCAEIFEQRNKDADRTGLPTLVSYIIFDETRRLAGTRIEKEGTVSLLRLSVSDSLEKHEEYAVLRRMAFNAHLTWADDYIDDLPSAKAKFRSKYNFNSSIENALSIKYKLHSIDSSLDPELNFSDPVSLAALVTKIVGFPGNKKSGYKPAIRELTMYEHRRWIVEKITDSWRTLEDISVLSSDTKDRKNRMHPCIVPSADPFRLSDMDWNTEERWNRATDADIKELDSLDRLSINMHQHFMKAAQILKDDRRELDYQEERITSVTARNSFASSVCSDLIRSIDELISSCQNRDSKALDAYKYYKKLLSGVAFSNEEKKTLDSALKKIDGILYPVTQATLFKNWKAVDEDLIRNIPFILTYSSAFHLCVPFFSENHGVYDTTELFNNVASSLMLNPLYLTYIVDGEEALSDFESFKKSLEYCVRTLENHRTQTELNVVILHKDINTLSQDNKKTLYDMSAKVRLVDEIVYTGWNQVKTLRDYLSQKSTYFTAIESNRTRVSGLLQSANELALVRENDGSNSEEGKFPMYTFDSRKRRFSTTPGCSFLNYIRNSNNLPNLLTSDLLYSRGKDVSFAEPELISEHKKLWELYTGNDQSLRNRCKASWKALCKAIKDRTEESNCIAKFPVFAKDAEYKGSAVFIFPFFCYETVNMIMDRLEQAKSSDNQGGYKFFDSKNISRFDTKSCILTVHNIRKDICQQLEEMLEDPFRLVEKSLVEVTLMPEVVRVYAFKLRIDDLKLPDKYSNRCYTILDEMNKAGYIRSYSKRSDNMVSFTFASENYMRLMKNEGSILELHVYRKALESGCFDDVKKSAMIMWNNRGTSNELDVVLIKGFETFIVECKATNELKAEFYDKLFPLTHIFGVNSIPVVMADLDGRESAGNKLQIARGQELGIETITEAEDPIKAMKTAELIK